LQTRLILKKEEDLKVLNWLTPIDFGPQHSDYLRRRQPGTGQWLLDCDIYQRWVDKPGQKLFCPGIPGAGKTILSSIVIDDLESRFSTDSTAVVVYVYCNFNRQAEQTLEHLLSSLLKQLTHSLLNQQANNDPSLPSVLYELHKKHAEKRTRPNLEEISAVLRTVTAAFAKVLIIVDALDECRLADNCRTRFLHQLFSLQTQQGVSLFATSRHMPDIEKEFSDSLTVEIQASEEDIGRYLKSAILRLPRFVAERSDLQDEITQTISQVVDGM
jgi:Cdc6-like AAA superfamily ATPase